MRSLAGLGMETVSPVARLAFVVGHGDDQNVIRLDGVEHTVGKYPDETDADIIF